MSTPTYTPTYTPIVVLAFDIERDGAFNTNNTIAIGCSVVDENLKELDRLFLPGYFKYKDQHDKSKFEPRCWDEFWSKNQTILDQLIYTGNLSFKERQKEMIVSFQDFRKKWELKSQEHGFKLELVVDHAVFDACFINLMIFEHLPGVLPIPYKASTQKWGGDFYDTSDLQEGLLCGIDLNTSSSNQNLSSSKLIATLYNVPECKVVHDHNPANDAYTIGYDKQVLNNIKKGVYKLK